MSTVEMTPPAGAKSENPSNDSVTTVGTTASQGRLWRFTLRLIISYLEALGRSSEEFYVYLPHTVQSGNPETSPA
ncbi:MAG TPA: hypothetical protein VEG61_00140 [Candidatus Dormibacteraeota bacterium]|nr:hypothetical protein [Candidatus Dormibacteraeota bacterium]